MRKNVEIEISLKTKNFEGFLRHNSVPLPSVGSRMDGEGVYIPLLLLLLAPPFFFFLLSSLFLFSSITQKKRYRWC
jgi:hypothetical protein